MHLQRLLGQTRKHRLLLCVAAALFLLLGAAGFSVQIADSSYLWSALLHEMLLFVLAVHGFLAAHWNNVVVVSSYRSKLSLAFFVWFLLFMCSLFILTTNEEHEEHMSVFWPLYTATAGLSVFAFTLSISACKNLLVCYRKRAELELAGDAEAGFEPARPHNESISQQYQESLLSRSSLVNSVRVKDSDDALGRSSPRLLQRFEFRRGSRAGSGEGFGRAFLGRRAASEERSSVFRSPRRN